MADEMLVQTLVFKLMVMGSKDDCHRLWQILDEPEAQQHVSRSFQRAIKEVILRADQMVEEDFTFRLEMSQNRHRPAINTVSRDRNFFAAITHVNAKLRQAGKEAEAEQFLSELAEMSTDGEVWGLISHYTNQLPPEEDTGEQTD